MPDNIHSEFGLFIGLRFRLDETHESCMYYGGGVSLKGASPTVWIQGL